MSDASEQMKAAWNERAQTDPYFYVETKFWDHDYGKFFALGEDRAKVIIDPILDKFAINGATKTAVDIGCGVGRFTKALGRRFDKAIGVDVSEIMVLRAKAATSDLSNLEFVVSDGVTLPKGITNVDFVWSYEVFQHMPSREVIKSNLREIARILRPGAYGLLHFRSAHEYPAILWYLAQLVPTSLLRMAKRLLGKDPLTADRAWRGAKALMKPTIASICNDAGLEIMEFRDDPTHAPGTRTFAVVRSSCRLT